MRQPRKRRPPQVMVTTRLDASVYASLNIYCKAKRMTRSNAIRIALNHLLWKV
jgi:antitoxin component of RelBE/YafQ-DinJ toxin-antitoxin module